MDNDKIELLQRVSMMVAPRIDRNILKTCLLFLTLVSEREVSEDLMKVLQRF